LHTLLPGYHLESNDWSRPGVAAEFLRAAAKLHQEMQLPCTVFARGQTVEEHPDDFRAARDLCGELMDFQQATYSNLPLKTVCRQDHLGTTLFETATLPQCRDDMARASDVMERVLGARPVGLAGPLGYYRGLSDRPDLLEMVARLGIRFTRTWSRNQFDAFPVPFEQQPFFYAPQGFPELLEIPAQGWPEAAWKAAPGFEAPEKFVRQMKKDLDYVAAKGLVWGWALTDWSCIHKDAEMRSTRAVLEQAREQEFRVLSHAQFWREKSAAIAAA